VNKDQRQVFAAIDEVRSRGRRGWILHDDRTLEEIIMPEDGTLPLVWLDSFARHHRIAFDVIAGRVAVSTIFTGAGPAPFETFVLGPDERPLEERRYMDLAATEQGHQELLGKWRAIVIGDPEGSA
jgi:hypothetical protein